MNHKELCRSCAVSFNASGGAGRVLINGDWFGPLCSTCHGKFILLAAQGGEVMSLRNGGSEVKSPRRCKTCGAIDRMQEVKS